MRHLQNVSKLMTRGSKSLVVAICTWLHVEIAGMQTRKKVRDTEKFATFVTFLFSSNPAKISAKCELCQYRICQGEYPKRRTICVKLNRMAHFMTVNVSRDCHVILFFWCKGFPQSSEACSFYSNIFKNIHKYSISAL